MTGEHIDIAWAWSGEMMDELRGERRKNSCNKGRRDGFIYENCKWENI